MKGAGKARYLGNRAVPAEESPHVETYPRQMWLVMGIQAIGNYEEKLTKDF